MNNGENIVHKFIDKANDSSKEHGNNLSVKIVVPSYCQAKCSFCFNNLTKDTQKHEYGIFLENLDNSLEMITNNITERGITLNITGNEPTFNMFLLMKIMNHLKLYRSKVNRIILSTNGFRIYDSTEYLADIVDIVNISLHHYDYHERKKIFGTQSIPNDEDLKKIVNNLKDNSISATAVSVLYKDIGDFKHFYDKFTNYAKDLGFKDVRIRSNYCSNDKFIDDYLKIDFPNQNINELPGLTTKIIVDEKTGFETRFLKGVPDLTEYVLGRELVIDDDGKCYIDYNKRYLLDESNIEYFNNFYVLDKNGKALKRKLTMK